MSTCGSDDASLSASTSVAGDDSPPLPVPPPSQGLSVDVGDEDLALAYMHVVAALHDRKYVDFRYGTAIGSHIFRASSCAHSGMVQTCLSGNL